MAAWVVAGVAAASDATVRVGSPEASLPMPVPKSPPPRAAAPKAAPADVAPAKPSRRGRGGADRAPKAAASVPAAPAAVGESPTAHSTKSTVNDLLSFLTFVERHPAGTSVNAVVDHYSSHGAYVRIDDVVGYVPLRLMAHPARVALASS